MFVSLYIAIVVIHLIGCYTHSSPLADGTKPLLMPLLAACLYSSGVQVSIVVYVALLLSFLGDMFLLKGSTQNNVTFGMLSFGSAHILYTITIIRNLIFFNPLNLALIVLVYLVISLFIYKKLRKYLPLNMKIPVIFYLVVIMTMSIASSLKLSTGYGFGSLLIFIGSLLFILSDIILAFKLFKGDTKYSRFFVMTSYILAQSLLIMGFAKIT